MNLASAGYVFSFQDKGAFAPDGKVSGQPSQAEIDVHNRELAKAELDAKAKTIERANAIHDLCIRIQKPVTEARRNALNGHAKWTTCGNLSHVQEQLERLAQFLGV